MRSAGHGQPWPVRRYARRPGEPRSVVLLSALLLASPPRARRARRRDHHSSPRWRAIGDTSRALPRLAGRSCTWTRAASSSTSSVRDLRRCSSSSAIARNCTGSASDFTSCDSTASPLPPRMNSCSARRWTRARPRSPPTRIMCHCSRGPWWALRGTRHAPVRASVVRKGLGTSEASRSHPAVPIPFSVSLDPVRCTSTTRPALPHAPRGVGWRGELR